MSFSMFYDILLQTFDRSFPKENIKINYTNKHSWINKGILNSIKHKNKLFYLSKYNPTKVNISIYKSYRNKLTTILRNAERNYYTNQLELNKCDLEKTWSVMKTIIGIKNLQNNITIINYGVITPSFVSY